MLKCYHSISKPIDKKEFDIIIGKYLVKKQTDETPIIKHLLNLCVFMVKYYVKVLGIRYKYTYKQIKHSYNIFVEPLCLHGKILNK